MRVIPNIERSQVKAKGLDLINQIFEKTLRRAKGPASHQAFLKGDQAAEEFLRVFESLHLPLARLSQPLLQKQEETTAREAFHEALLASGLVKELKSVRSRTDRDRPLVPIQGRPLSETIVEERR